MRPHPTRRDHVSTAAGPRHHGRARHRVVVGIHAIQETLRVGARQIKTIWLAEGKEGKRLRQVVALATARGTPIEVVAESRLVEAAGTTAHQGIVAFVASTPLLTFDQLATRFAAQSPIPPVVVLDGVKDPRNLGAIIRSAAVFGIGGVIVPGRRAVGITATVTKAAAGGLEHVGVAEVTNISASLKRLKRLGFWVVGADEQGEISCRAFSFPSPLALVFGDEGSGISPLVKRHCDALVGVPGRGPLRSLNVAVAAAVLFYEVTGQDLQGRGEAVKPVP